MKYLLAKNNHKPDFTYENALYFNTVIDRDNYISTYLFDGEEWRNQITKTTQKDRIKQDGTGEIIINENTLSRKEIYDKNYIILRDCDEDEPEFYFIINVDHQSGNQYLISVQKDVITSTPGFMKDVGRMELIEGHVNEQSILDMVIDGGYKVPKIIQRLERDFDFQSIYPGKDVGILNNQWLYVFIKQKTETGDFPLFKLDNQIMPYRVLVAPLNEIIVNDISESKNTISKVNDGWENVIYPHNQLPSGVEQGSDESLNYIDQQDRLIKLEKETYSDVINNPIDTFGNIKLSFNFKYKANFGNAIDINDTIEIPYDVFNRSSNGYKDNWFPIYIGSDKKEYDSLNNELWTTGETKEAEYNYIVAFELKWNTSTGKIDTRVIKRDRTINSELLKAKGISGKSQKIVDLIIIGKKMYGSGEKNEEIEFLSPYRKITLEGTPKGGNSRWPYMTSDDFFNPIEQLFPNEWSFTVKEVFQGKATGLDNPKWNSKTLLEYVNSQSNPQDDAKEELISAKISSFNPLELTSDGWLLNIKDKDSATGPVTPEDWKNDSIYELIYQDTEYNDLLNTYDLTKYQDKSWIKGINNYSILIENNKEFDIKPEYVYTQGKFSHRAIISPNEWVERIKWPFALHSDQQEFVNNKEIIFATNAFNQYQANNPGDLSNQRADNNADLLSGAITTAVTGIGAIATGGALLYVGAGAVGAGTIINNRKNKRNLKHNIAMMKEQPVISSGNGSAYADLYLNNNAFGLTLVEWQYTTNQAPSVIDSVIRSGLQFQNTISVGFDSIKRPQFNYFKLTNAQEALTGVKMSIAEKQLIIDAFDAGIRLWYDPANFLKFTEEGNPYNYNNTLFTRDMINYVDWNKDDN